ncbi:MAG: DUF6702 family protein, partial [Gemmatimonadota bacterium]
MICRALELGALALLASVPLAAPDARRGHEAAAPRTAIERAHPVHTSLTRIELDGRGKVMVRVRTFSDDFAAAVTRATGTAAGPDYSVPASAAELYVGERVVVATGGRRVALRLLSQKRDGDVTWLELIGSGMASLKGVTVESRLLTEFHADQVNVVQVKDGAGSRT